MLRNDTIAATTEKSLRGLLFDEWKDKILSWINVGSVSKKKAAVNEHMRLLEERESWKFYTSKWQ